MWKIGKYEHNDEKTVKVHSDIASSSPNAQKSYGYEKNVLNLYILEIKSVLLAFEGRDAGDDW